MAARTFPTEQKKNLFFLTGFVIRLAQKINAIDKRKKLIVLIGIFLIGLFGWVARNGITSKAIEQEIKPVSNQVSINKNFEFFGYDNRGFKKSKMKFTITTAEKANDVLVNNQNFQAKNGKIFLLVNLEYTNDTNQPLSIIPDNLVRLVYNGNAEKKFSADLHNNAVGVAAISTKSDRIGFVIPFDAKDLKLLVGELDGKKEEVSLPI